MPEQEDDQQGEEQERQAGIEQQAARADVGTIQNFRADYVGVAILPTAGLARQRRSQQAGNPAANRPGQRRRVRGLQHVFAEPVRVCRGEVRGFIDRQTEAPRLISQDGGATHHQKPDSGVPSHDDRDPGTQEAG